MRLLLPFVFLSFFLFISSTVSAADMVCNPGSYLATDRCLPCPQGSFQSEAGVATECTKCFRDTYSDVEGAIECQLCPPGYNAPDRGAKTCNICPGGHYIDPAQAQQRLSLCLPCAAGQWSRPASISCQYCPPGFFSKEGADLCTPCPINTYAPDDGSTICLACPDGYNAPAASAACSATVSSNNIDGGAAGEGSNADSTLSTNRILAISLGSVAGVLGVVFVAILIRRLRLRKSADNNRLMMENQKRSSLYRSSFSQTTKPTTVDSETATVTESV